MLQVEPSSSISAAVLMHALKSVFSCSELVQEISVTGEVILSAGPYHSPKLLQLSGIGPAAVLQSFDIPQVAELPVGQSAQVCLEMSR